jgi:hypothetical protein
MPPTGFESAIPVSERLQTDALDRAATRIGSLKMYAVLIFCEERNDSSSNYYAILNQ